MTVIAISTGAAILAWIGLALGVVVLLVVIALLAQVLRPAQEIDRYAESILEAGVGIATNLDGVEQLGETRRLANATPGLAVRYLQKLGLAR